MSRVIRYLLPALFTGIVVSVLSDSCKKDAPPPNPYDTIDYGTGGGSSQPPDPNTIVGIHYNILRVKCAMPGCHDGHFEPDYRTVQSSYSTLVYHPVKKYTVDSAFRYRVVPYDTAASWFHERLTTDDANLGRMPLYSSPLSASEMNCINKWIMDGARDMFGNSPALPNTKPVVVGYIATDSAFNRIDSIRVGGVFYNPFIVSANSKIKIVMVVEDDSTAVSALTVNKLKLSYAMNDFASSAIYSAYYFSLGGYSLWIADVNASVFSVGDVLYMRYYVNDGNHAADTEFPSAESAAGYKTYYSFKIQ